MHILIIMACVQVHRIVISPLSHVASCPGDKKGTIPSYTHLGDALIVVIRSLVKFIVHKPLEALIVIP